MISIAKWVLVAVMLAGLALATVGQPPPGPVVVVVDDVAFETRQAAEAQWYYAYYWHKLDQLDAPTEDFVDLDEFVWGLETDLDEIADAVREWMDFESASLYIESLRTERLSEWYGTTDAVRFANVKPNDPKHPPGWTGKPRVPDPKAKPHDQHTARREAEIAKILSEVLAVEQQPDTKNDPPPYDKKNADLRVNGQLADVYTPETTGTDEAIRSRILKEITEKSKTQAGIVIVDLSDFSPEFIVAFLDVFTKQAENPKQNNDRFAKLAELWIVDDKGVIQRVWPQPPERIAPPKK